MHKNPQCIIIVVIQKISYDKNNILYDMFLRFEYFREPLYVILTHTHTHTHTYMQK